MEADIILFHPYDSDRFGFSGMHPESDERYLRYTVTRSAAFRNVWWSITNEYDLLKTKQPSESQITLADFSRAFLLRDAYCKPIIYDEVGYEGNIESRWGRLAAEEMVL